MINFTSDSFFARLKQVDNSSFNTIINDILIDNERIVGCYQSIRDGVVFTNKRILTINVQGIMGKKKDFTSIPYNKITAFSLASAGVLDFDCELFVYIATVGMVKFEFIGSTNVKEICKTISTYTL